jgi:hypothetical protein
VRIANFKLLIGLLGRRNNLRLLFASAILVNSTIPNDNFPTPSPISFKKFLSQFPSSKVRPNLVKRGYQIYKAEYGDPAARQIGKTSLKTVGGLKDFFISVRETQIEFLFLNENYYLGLLEACDF